MSTKNDLKTLHRNLMVEWNKGKTAAMTAIDELFATNFIYHRGIGDETHGIKELKESMSGLFNGFPDIHFATDEIITEGNKQATRLTITGTHKGEFMGIAPTNKKIKMSVLHIDTFARGKCVESWERFDTLGLMQQLGVVPTPEKK
jgi:predicted ester cyclase